MKIDTKRLILREFHILDSAPLKSIFLDPEVMEFGETLESETVIRDWVRMHLKNYSNNWGFGPYAVVEKTSGVVIGYCGLFYFPNVNGKEEVEVGYRLAKSCWGQGYATEAARAVRDYAFNVLGLSRLIAIIEPNNIRSIRVAEKLNMVRESEVKLSEEWTHPDFVYVVNKHNLGQ